MIILALGLIVCGGAFAQFPVTDGFDRGSERTDTIRVLGPKRGAHWVVKFSPLAIIDPESTWRLDLERTLGRNFSLQGGLGYGNSYANLFTRSNSSVRERETWRAQLEGRFYIYRDQPANRWIPVRRITQKPLGDYLAIETFYKQVAGFFDGTLSRGCTDGNCQFFERYSATARRYVAGFHFKYGQQMAIRLTDANNRLLIDYYVGVGVRWRWSEQLGVPQREDSAQQNGQWNTWNGDPTSNWGGGSGRYPSLALGIQLGYAF